MADQPYANVEMLAAGVEHMQESWTLSVHSQPITSLCVHGVTLFSAGRDCQLILYDLSPTHERAPPEMLASFTLPRVAQSIAADRSRIYAATGSCDIDVLEWSEDEGMLIGDGEPLEGHTRAVTALAVHDGLLYSSANDSTVKLWDGVQLLMTLAEGVDPCGSLSVLGDRIVSTPHAGGHALSLWRFSLLQVKAKSTFALPGWLASLTKARDLSPPAMPVASSPCAGPSSRTPPAASHPRPPTHPRQQSRKDGQTVRVAGGRAAAAAAASSQSMAVGRKMARARSEDTAPFARLVATKA